MILSSGPSTAGWAGLAPLAFALAVAAMLAYGFAAWQARTPEAGEAVDASAWRWAWLTGWLLHALLLVLDITGWGREAPGARLGFGPVLSLTCWLVAAVHAWESRLAPLPPVRRVLSLAGLLGVALAWAFPGEPHLGANTLAPWHWMLGVASYGLFGAAVLHGWMLDRAEASLRRPSPLGLARASGDAAYAAGLPSRSWGPRPEAGHGAGVMGMPLLRLEKLTFRFVEAGFAVLTLAVLFGLATASPLKLTHKLVFSVLGWGVFAGLVWGRHARGWRGRRATRWLYVGAGLLLLAYVGSRFVLEVLLRRGGTVG